MSTTDATPGLHDRYVIESLVNTALHLIIKDCIAEFPKRDWNRQVKALLILCEAFKLDQLIVRLNAARSLVSWNVGVDYDDYDGLLPAHASDIVFGRCSSPERRLNLSDRQEFVLKFQEHLPKPERELAHLLRKRTLARDSQVSSRMMMEMPDVSPLNVFETQAAYAELFNRVIAVEECCRRKSNKAPGAQNVFLLAYSVFVRHQLLRVDFANSFRKAEGHLDDAPMWRRRDLIEYLANQKVGCLAVSPFVAHSTIVKFAAAYTPIMLVDARKLVEKLESMNLMWPN